ncbi:MAG: hypothetical protein AUF76_07470 [Acidobacteria bacterium 13_1_20CM_2_65_9]|nr:MAG: hypothetical protein AUF76_07470 [Acidobacteria bacterium 13_1_20CM_2_65_9]
MGEARLHVAIELLDSDDDRGHAIREGIQLVLDSVKTIFRHAILRGGTTTLASSAPIGNRNDDAARIFEGFLVRAV